MVEMPVLWVRQTTNLLTFSSSERLQKLLMPSPKAGLPSPKFWVTNTLRPSIEIKALALELKLQIVWIMLNCFIVHLIYFFLLLLVSYYPHVLSIWKNKVLYITFVAHLFWDGISRLSSDFVTMNFVTTCAPFYVGICTLRTIIIKILIILILIFEVLKLNLSWYSTAYCEWFSIYSLFMFRAHW